MGLSYLPIVLYVMAIRPRMDFSTGLVGASVGISWQALGEWVYIEPHSGIQSGSPTKAAIRRATECLQRAGLLSIKSDGKRLILSCILAQRDKSVQKQAGTKPAHQADIQADTSAPAPLLDSGTQADTQADIPKTEQAGTHPVSGNTSILPPPPIELAVLGVGVEFANILKTQNRPAVSQYLERVKPEHRQDMVDDLLGYMQIKADKGEAVKSPAGVISRMVSRYKRGEYVADNAHIGQMLRRQQDIFTNPIPTPSPTEKNKPKPIPANIREKINGVLRREENNHESAA